MSGFSRNEIAVSLNPEEIFGRPKIPLWSSFLQVDVDTAVLEHGDKVETILLRTCFLLPGVLGSVLIVQATAFPRDCLELYKDSEDEVLVTGVNDVASVTAFFLFFLSLSFWASYFSLLALSNSLCFLFWSRHFWRYVSLSSPFFCCSYSLCLTAPGFAMFIYYT